MKTFTNFAELAAELHRREQEEKKAAYDANFAPNATRCANYNAIENALEDAFDQFAEQDDGCYDSDRAFVFENGGHKISITERDAGFEIDFNGKACLITELAITSSLVRYFLG